VPVIQGGAGPDILNGGDGDDEIWGGVGSDTLHGGAGNDWLYADSSNGLSPDEVGTVNYLFGDAGNDVLTGGAGKDFLDGGEGNDSLAGNSGDVLLGGPGNDSLRLALADGATLDGGAGDDVLTLNRGANTYTGGAGADTFHLPYNVLYAGGIGVITDFNAAEGDRLGSSGALQNRRVWRGAVENQNFSLTVGDTFSNHDYGSEVEQIWTWVSGGDTYLIVDADSSRSFTNVDIVVRFPGLVPLDASSFASGALSTVSGTDGDDAYVSKAVNRGDLYYGRGGADTIHGSSYGDQLYGGAGDDQIWGERGNDGIWGGAGDDRIDGGGESDSAGYSGASTDYRIARAADGSVRVEDLRGLDGIDTLTSIEVLRFSDRLLALSYASNGAVELAFKSVLRAASTEASQLGAVFAISGLVLVEGASPERINLGIIQAADATTSVAAMSYQFFTGKVPTEAGFDFLISPTGPNSTNLNSAYYAQFDTVNRYINFAVNLGKNGEAKASFAADYGSLSLFDATKKAYAAIFGGMPTDAKVHALIDTRVDYLAYYGGDGATGIGAKAAMVGFLLAAAATEDVGVLSRSNDAWLMDLAIDGKAPYAVNILDPANGYYKADFIFGG